LQENRQHARQSRRGASYLLQGLLQCQHCGYAFYGNPLSPSARKGAPEPMPITGVSAPRPSALAATASVPTPKCGPIASNWRCGRKCVPFWHIRNDSPRNFAAACGRMARASARSVRP
jgi:hypothetical protein